MPPMKMKHTIDPKKEILDAVGDIKEVEIFNNQILVGIYIRPQMTASGILLTDKTVDEDKYQGKVGLVLKMGPEAFVDESGKWFKNMKIKVGDWVVFRPSDGWSVSINGKSCRILDDVAVRGRVQSPDIVW
jgi:co-chaperonin GroES (HSP10)